MTLTDKCLAMATATVLIYGMVFAGTSSSSNDTDTHDTPIHHQARDDMSRQDSARS
ncbi:hypothetical protein M1D97_05245 [Kushneria sp. AK178]